MAERLTQVDLDQAVRRALWHALLPPFGAIVGTIIERLAWEIEAPEAPPDDPFAVYYTERRL